MRTGRHALALAMALVAVISVPQVEAQSRAAPTTPQVQQTERPLYAEAQLVQAFRIDSLLPLGSPLARNGSVLIGNVRGVINVALVKEHSPGAKPLWVPFQNFIAYVADSGYTAYVRPLPNGERYRPPNSDSIATTRAQKTRTDVLVIRLK